MIKIWHQSFWQHQHSNKSVQQNAHITGTDNTTHAHFSINCSEYDRSRNCFGCFCYDKSFLLNLPSGYFLGQKLSVVGSITVYYLSQPNMLDYFQPLLPSLASNLGWLRSQTLTCSEIPLKNTF